MRGSDVDQTKTRLSRSHLPRPALHMRDRLAEHRMATDHFSVFSSASNSFGSSTPVLN